MKDDLAASGSKGTRENDEGGTGVANKGGEREKQTIKIKEDVEKILPTTFGQQACARASLSSKRHLTASKSHLLLLMNHIK